MPYCPTSQVFEDELSKRLLGLLDSSKSVNPAMTLAKHFGGVGCKYFQTEEVLSKLVEAKQIALAVDLAANSGHQMQVKPFHACMTVWL